MCDFDKLDKPFVSDLYLIYKRSPLARFCISDKDQLLMFYLSLIDFHCLISPPIVSARISYRMKNFDRGNEWCGVVSCARVARPEEEVGGSKTQ